MALSTRLELRQGQQLVMTPQLQQAIRLLQLSNLELLQFVETELERNPLLEREEGEEAPKPAGEPEPSTEFAEANGEVNGAATAEADEQWLDLGAVRPPEIAVAVLADLVARRAAGQLHAAADVAAPTETRDPVCGMAVHLERARHRYRHDGTDYCFCSAGCRRAFVADPGAYLQPS